MVNCCCSNIGTSTCLVCPNQMSGVGDRYPAPYFKELITMDVQLLETCLEEQVHPI